VYYTTQRKTTAAGATQYRLTNDAGSTYGDWGIHLGAHILKTGAYLTKAYMTLPPQPYGTLINSSYVVGTTFTLYGNMSPSNGTCDNVFSGTLYY